MPRGFTLESAKKKMLASGGGVKQGGQKAAAPTRGFELKRKGSTGDITRLQRELANAKRQKDFSAVGVLQKKINKLKSKMK